MAHPDSPNWDREVDVVVLGTGAAGLTAALTAAVDGASVAVYEKAPTVGGTTAVSGGVVWTPAHHRSPDVDLPVEDALTYLRAQALGAMDEDLVGTFVRTGESVIDFVEKHSDARFEIAPGYLDYKPELPGGKAVGGRSLSPMPYEVSRVGEWAEKITTFPADWSNVGFDAETRARLNADVDDRGGEIVVAGGALIAGLLKGLLDRGVVPVTDARALELISDSGSVIGVRIQLPGSEIVVRARRGVILGTGGFEHNDAMRKQYQRAPIGTEWTTGAPSNTGDGITAGIKAGADVALMDDAWWGPTIPLPKGPWFALSERSVPGTFIVNERGERFMNESLPYVEAAHHMYGGDFGQGDGPGENVPAWMIMDTRCRGRYLFAGLTAKQPIPKSWLASGVIVKADTIAELAEKIGVPAENLVATTEKFNGFARDGVDKDFGRGASGYDHYYGDITNKPNPSLGPVDKGPFYAVKMVPGDLGTKGGIVTDEDGRALRPDGSVINGLYAAGNTSAPVMGHTYAGPGATIGPAMVFGYLAALDAKAKADAAASSTAASGA